MRKWWSAAEIRGCGARRAVRRAVRGAGRRPLASRPVAVRGGAAAQGEAGHLSTGSGSAPSRTNPLTGATVATPANTEQREDPPEAREEVHASNLGHTGIRTWHPSELDSLPREFACTKDPVRRGRTGPSHTWIRRAGSAAALAGGAGLAAAAAARAAPAGREQRKAERLPGLRLLVFRGDGDGGIGHGSSSQAACAQVVVVRRGAFVPSCLRLIHAQPHRRVNGALGLAPTRRHPAPDSTTPRPRPRPAGHTRQMPSTCVGCWSSSACSPVTRYTTRFATDTAWSANRS